MSSVIEAAIDDLKAIVADDSDPLHSYIPDQQSLFPDHELYFLLRYLLDTSTVEKIRTTKNTKCRTPLGRLALQFQAVPLEDNFQYDRNTCQESEPRFLKALHFNHRRQKHSASAVVYVGPDQYPVAYRKNNGDPRVIMLETTPALPYIPAGVIVDFPRNPIGSEERTTANPSLSVATFPAAESRTPFEILRPSTFMLDPSYVASTNYMPIVIGESRTPSLAFAELATRTTIDDIRDKVHELFDAA